jgi:peptidyl-prolyl cis-trans isomerase SurA
MNYFIYILLFLSFLKAQQEVILDKVSSVVENKIVLLSDVVLAANAIAAQENINPNNNPYEYQTILESARESMIEQLLIIEMAKQDSVEVLKKDIDRALDEQIDNIILQTGGKDQAEVALGKKISDFKRSYRDDMEGKLLAEKYTAELTSSIQITRKEVENFYNTYKDSLPILPTTYKARHILIEINPSEKTLNETLNKTKKIKNEIINGLDFSKAAKTYSDDINSKVSGGNLGYVSRGVFVPEFEKAAFTLEKNILSDPIKTKFGFHLIEVLDKTGEKINVRHILIQNNISNYDKKQAYNKAINIKNNIKNIDDFFENSKNFSDDNTNKLNGGFLGIIDVNNYQIPEISNALKKMNSNEVSSPILTDFGYHILWIDYIKEGGTTNLKNNWQDIENLALSKKKADWYQDWINKIKSQFFVKRNPLTYPQVNN